jgi:uncharacterized protein (TIGR03437 family)
MDGVSVTVGGADAYLCYVSPTQLNVLAPFRGATSSDSAAVIQVTAPDGTAQALALQREFAPGIFVFGGQNAAAVHADGALVCADGSLPGVTCRPAKPGEAIAIYLTGLGTKVDPMPADGMIISTPSVLRDALDVTLGGAPCTVLYQGLVGAGLYQVNVQIPDIASGDQPLIARIGGVSTQAGPILTVGQ